MLFGVYHTKNSSEPWWEGRAERMMSVGLCQSGEDKQRGRMLWISCSSLSKMEPEQSCSHAKCWDLNFFGAGNWKNLKHHPFFRLSGGVTAFTPWAWGWKSQKTQLGWTAQLLSQHTDISAGIRCLCRNSAKLLPELRGCWMDFCASLCSLTAAVKVLGQHLTWKVKKVTEEWFIHCFWQWKRKPLRSIQQKWSGNRQKK